jgi:hypothetical protein
MYFFIALSYVLSTADITRLREGMQPVISQPLRNTRAVIVLMVKIKHSLWVKGSQISRQTAR